MGQVNRISKTGLELIKGFEGLRRRSEPLDGGGWIVGYGHSRSARQGVEVTEREAEYLLRYDLQDVEEFVSHHVHAPLNQNEFDALVSFCWNIGKEAFSRSDVLNYVNAGEMLAAAESFSAWRKARIAGRLIVVDALVRRRTAEKNLFLSHPSGPPSAPSKVVRPELDVAASVLALSDGALSIEAKMNAPENMAVNPVLPSMIANDRFEEAKVENITVDVEDEVIAEADVSLDEPEEVVEEVEINLLDQAQDEAVEVQELVSDGSLWAPSDLEDGEEEVDELSLAVEDETTDEDEAEAYGVPELDEDDQDDDEDMQDDLSRAMAAASLAAGGAVLVSEVLEDDEENAAVADLDVLDEAVVEDDEELADEELADLTEDFHEEEGEAAAEIIEGHSSSLDIAEADEADEAEAVETVWNGETEEAFEAETELEAEAETEVQAFAGDIDETAYDEADEQPRRIVIDDIEHPNGMTVDEVAAMEVEETMPISGQQKSGNGFVAILPFFLLAIIGLIMAVLGVLDWWKLIQSDAPINENQLYAGPFLTLIGGFALVFGLYFTIRKLVVKDS